MLGRAAAAVDPGAVRDRIVQAAVKIVIEPIFETDFQPPRSAFGRGWRRTTPCRCSSTSAGGQAVVETDIASCFEEIPHDRLIWVPRLPDRHDPFRRARSNAGALVPGSVVRRQPMATRWRGSRPGAASATSAGVVIRAR
jgi:hypothetical protein